MSRECKTSKKNRTTYVFYDAYGQKIAELKPGEEGVTEANIELLHEMDDAGVDEQRRFEYRTTYLDTYSGDEEKSPDEYNKLLADDQYDPLTLLLAEVDKQEHLAKLDNLRMAMESLQPQQLELIRKVYVDNRSNTDIAAEENVSEAAIRNRLKKIYEKLHKFSS